MTPWSATNGSGLVLEQLERRNLLVVPLDRRREWYRYHHAVPGTAACPSSADASRSVVADLHRRAAAWFESNGRPEAAIDHAQAAGDDDRVARPRPEARQPRVGERTLRHRAALDGVVRGEQAARAPPGDRRARGADLRPVGPSRPTTERWAAAADRGDRRSTLADGNTLEGHARLPARAAVPRRGGGDAPRRRARRGRARRRQPVPRHDAPRRGAVVPARRRRPSGADAIFALAVETRARSRRAHRSSPSSSPSAASPRSTATTGRRPRRTPARRWRCTEGGRFDDYWTSALVFAFAARVLAQRGDDGAGHGARGAGGSAPAAAHLRPAVVSVQALLEMARAYLALGDRGGARAVLRQADDIFRQRPALGVLPTIADELRRRVDAIQRPGVGGVVADRRRAPPPAAAAHPPDVPRDRRAAVRLPTHRQDAGDLDLPQVRCVVPQRGDRPGRTSSACSTSADRPADADRPMWAMNARSCRPTVGLSEQFPREGAENRADVCL